MKLIKAHVTNYRNILDSNEVEVGQTTCLVGKNEAGKSAFLKALEGLRSTNANFKQYGKTENYPRRFLADYEARHTDAEARVIETIWELSAEDIASVEAVLGKGVLESGAVTISKTYEQDGTTWALPLNNVLALSNLITMHSLSPEDSAPLAPAKDTKKAFELLNGVATRSPTQAALHATIGGFRDHSAYLRAIDVLSARTPKFMYFSHYDRMSGELSINSLNAKKQQSQTIDSGDRVFLDFLEYSGTTLDDLVATNQFEELNAKCEAAALRITESRFRKFGR